MWVKLDYRRVKFLTIDFIEEVTLQPFNIMTQAIESQKQMIMWFAENLGVLNEKRCKYDHTKVKISTKFSNVKTTFIFINKDILAPKLNC